MDFDLIDTVSFLSFDDETFNGFNFRQPPNQQHTDNSYESSRPDALHASASRPSHLTCFCFLCGGPGGSKQVQLYVK